MTVDEEKRLCKLCDRYVYNIESMSVPEAAALLRQASNSRTCVRLHRRADGTVLTSDCPTGLRAYRQRVGRMGAAVFASIVGLFSFATAQRPFVSDSTGRRSETFL